jgi:hypothetical protein
MSSSSAVDRSRGDFSDLTHQLLRLCLQGSWEPKALEAAQEVGSSDEIAWDALLLAARRGGVASLLYRVIRGRDLLPESVERQLRGDYFATAQQNIRLFHELEQIIGSLAQSIPTILLKGAALAEPIYGNVALRPMHDIDLLVHERDVPAALQALASLGYTVVPPRAYRCQVLLRPHKEGLTPIELHWSLFTPFFYHYQLSSDWLWETAKTVNMGSTPARILGPEAQLLHLCGHLTLHHSGGEALKELWMCDVALVIEQSGLELDWDELLARARTYGLTEPLRRVLFRVNHSWPGRVPVRTMERLSVLRPSLEEHRASAMLLGLGRPTSLTFLAELATLPDYRARLHFLWRNLFPPLAYLRQIYPASQGLRAPLIYPYRWLRILRTLVSHRS